MGLDQTLSPAKHATRAVGALLSYVSISSSTQSGSHLLKTTNNEWATTNMGTREVPEPFANTAKQEQPPQAREERGEHTERPRFFPRTAQQAAEEAVKYQKVESSNTSVCLSTTYSLLVVWGLRGGDTANRQLLGRRVHSFTASQPRGMIMADSETGDILPIKQRGRTYPPLLYISYI